MSKTMYEKLSHFMRYTFDVARKIYKDILYQRLSRFHCYYELQQPLAYSQHLNMYIFFFFELISNTWMLDIFSFRMPLRRHNYGNIDRLRTMGPNRHFPNYCFPGIRGIRV